MRTAVGLWLLAGLLSTSTGAAEPRFTLEGHHDAVTCLAYAPDGQTLATGSKDGTVRLWDAAGKERATLPGHERMVTALAFAPDGKTLATTGSTRASSCGTRPRASRRPRLPGIAARYVGSPSFRTAGR